MLSHPPPSSEMGTLQAARGSLRQSENVQISKSLKNMSCFFDRTRLILKIIFIIDYSASFS